MKKRLLFFSYYILFWLSFFIITRLLFLLVYHNLSFQLSMKEWFFIFEHGFKMDLSAIGYILLMPGLATVLTSNFKGNVLKKTINIYTAVILGITSFIVIVDLELYKYWGFRLDSSPLLYINTPKDMMASVPVWIYVRQILIGVIIYCIFYFSYKKWLFNRLENLEAGKWQAAGLFLFLTAALIIPIRGGFGIAPMNVGTAYFSENLFENHASINVVWNAGYSLANLNSVDKSYDYLKPEESEQLFHSLDQRQEGEVQKVFNQKNPNIVLVIVESFTSKLIEPLGGRQGVTPQFNQLLKEGILFDHLYASGDRSDKGIVALLSGFPALPNSSIIKFAQKTQQLPYLTKDLKKIGYNTAFYYGGDVDFANLRSYLTLAGFDKIVCKDSFPPSTYNSKWGVHDHIVFNKLFNDISQSKGPFFKTYFTLSNHDPFDVPMKTVFAGKDDDNKFLNSAYYTDQCIGNFVRRAKKAPWWKNTVIIFVADHGSPRP
ncbi:MAG: sulfatase-like hydrolase/transferase [Bacteroidota bacterium]|nr:sulfatase-like hydrolase/transferase [Bacteroidota bacterium]